MDAQVTIAPTLIDHLFAHAAATPEKLFMHMTLRGVVSTRSYEALLEESLVFAGTYREAGVGAGDVVLIFLRTRADMYAAFFGAMMVGAVPSYMACPSAKQLPELYWSSHAELFRHMRPAAILAARDDLAAMSAHSPALATDTMLLPIEALGTALPRERVVVTGPDDVCLLQHSSGTTGLKKGLLLTFAAVTAQLETLGRALHTTRDDVMITWLPVYHDMGLIGCTLFPLMFGQTMVVLDPFEWSADPGSMLRAIETHRGTIAWLPNFAFEHLARRAVGDFDLSSMRVFNSSAEPCKIETFDRFAARFGVPAEKLLTSYGMAENVLAATQVRPGMPVRALECSETALREEGIARAPLPGEPAVRLLSNGPPLDNVVVEVRDRLGWVLPEGRVGELCVSGASLFDGYHKRPEATAERLIGGVYHTRDLGFLDDGEVFVLGRLDDLIIVHGRNIYAHEVELAANTVPGIKAGRVVAFGVENARAGSDEIVVVAETEELERAVALQRAIKEAVFQITGFTIREARLVALNWIVKTTSGKISREKNRVKFLEG